MLSVVSDYSFDGQIGSMSRRKLAESAGVALSTLQNVLENVATDKHLTEPLKPFAGTILDPTESIPDLLCAGIITHYALKGKVEAIQSVLTFSAIGIRTWIKDQSGYKEPKQLRGIFERFRRLNSEIILSDGYFAIAFEIQGFLSDIAEDYDWSADEWADLVDGSVGSTWANYCKKSLVPAYSSRIDAKYKGLKINSYKNEYLADFRHWFKHVYIKEKFPAYIKSKQAKGALLPVNNKALDFRPKASLT